MALIIKRKASLKRKNAHNPQSVQRKRQRKEVASANDLPWKKVSRPSATGFEGDDGILELEEVDDVEVVYEETENGQSAGAQNGLVQEPPGSRFPRLAWNRNPYKQ